MDLGSSTLKLGHFQVDAGGGLTLVDYVIRDLGLDPNKEQEMFPFLVEALQGIVRERKLASFPVYCSISGQYVFTRFVKLPPVAPDQIEQMIGFEAQQNVPFPINEVVWDYQLLGGRGAKDIEAVIVAVKSDLVEQANSVLSLCKLELEKVDVAPLALVNAHKYNYPESDACHLIIDIGAKCTNLVFIEGKKIFCRAIPIGGHLISQNISNEFQEPYVAAEMMKRGKGFVGLGGAYADPDDQTAARISKIARSVFSRLHAEISRSISFYRNQQSGSSPQKVLLAGGASAMPYTDLFFREKLNMPVEFFNPLSNIKLSPKIDLGALGSDAYLLGEVVGLATRRLDDVPVEVNLVPASVADKRAVKRRLPYLAVAFVVWVLMLAVLVGSSLLSLDRLSVEANDLESDLNNKNQLAHQIEKESKAFSRDSAITEGIQKLLEQRNFWPHLLGVVYESTGAFNGIWVSQMELAIDNTAKLGGLHSNPRGPAPPGSAILQMRGFFEVPENNGREKSDDLLAAFVSKLQTSGYFDSVKVTESDVFDSDQVARKFTIQAALKAEKTPDLQP